MAGEPVLFIVNPASGGGKTARDWAAIESGLPATGLRYETAFTTRPMEAVDIAKNAVRRSRPVVVAVGGDGTLNEVVNGFFHNGAPIPTTSRMAMVPLGTGGDFRRTLRIPLEPKAAIQVLSDGLVRRLDAGCVTYQNGDGSTGVRHFINIADAGLGGDVVKQVGHGPKRFGSPAYTLGGVPAPIGFKNKAMTVEIDHPRHEIP